MPGESDIDQLGRVVKMFGALEPGWPGVCLLPDYGKIQFPKSEGIPLGNVLPDASEGARALLGRLLQVNPGGIGVDCLLDCHLILKDAPCCMQSNVAQHRQPWQMNGSMTSPLWQAPPA